MKKRLLAMLLSITLVLGLLVLPAAAGELSNFTKVNSYAGQFKDVAAGAWYESGVKTTYEFGLLSGKSAVRFDPASNLTLAEAAKLAACLHSLYETGAANFALSSPWHQSYVDYLNQKGLLNINVTDWSAKATRAQFAQLLSQTLPTEALAVINELKDGAIPDVAANTSYHDAVYLLYRAGILTGSDSRGSFKPNANIQRSEVAVIITRMVDVNQRKVVELSPAMTAQEVFNACSPAVVYIEVADAAGKVFATGSGFFISADGKLVTNSHVIEGAASATVKTTDGKTHKVLGAYDANETMDLALLQVEGSGFPYLPQGDSKNLSTGAAVFAIGSPLGFDNTLSTGIISNPSRVSGATTYIQTTAAISHGSSGGALLNDLGQVIGVTTASREDGQSMNFAVPIHLLSNLKTTNYQTLSTVTARLGAVSAKASKTAISIPAGTTAQVLFVVSDPSGKSMQYSCEVVDTSIAALDDERWIDDDNYEATIYGYRAGTSTLEFVLYDDNDNVLSTVNVTVTVTGTATSGGTSTTGTTKFYPGFYPAPDFGAYTGTPVYAESGGMYLYRIADMKVSGDTAVYGYLGLAEDMGFYYDTSFVSDTGVSVSVYENSTYGVTLMYSLETVAGEPCVCVYVL